MAEHQNGCQIIIQNEIINFDSNIALHKTEFRERLKLREFLRHSLFAKWVIPLSWMDICWLSLISRERVELTGQSRVEQ